MRILITGSEGQIGTELVSAFAGHDVVGATRETLDITDRASVLAACAALPPDAVVHAAAFTAVDACETEPDHAFAVNALGTRNVAEAAGSVRAHLVYFSTDYVFDGTKPAPYNEWDAPNPLSVYGRSKLAGEEATRVANKRHFIVRSAWLFGTGGSNFVETMLRLAGDHGEVLVVRDQVKRGRNV